MLIPDPDAVDFGQVWVAVTKFRPVGWSNTGTTDVVLSGQYTFTTVNGPVPEFSAPLASSGQVTVAPNAALNKEEFSFTPSHEGEFHAYAEPTLADPRIGSIIQPSSLKGNGKARDEFGDLSIGPGGYVPPIGPYGTNKALDFGDIPVGGHSYRTIELNNTGGLSMTVNIKYELNGSSPFVVSDTGGHAAIHSASIAAQSSLFFVITFSPTKPGYFGDAIFFFGAAGNLAALAVKGQSIVRAG